MKKWNTPEIAELNISETAKNDSYLLPGHMCSITSSSCIRKGNGGGQCNNCDRNPNKGPFPSTSDNEFNSNIFDVVS